MNQNKIAVSDVRNISAAALNINFKLLQAFVLVAEYNSFRRAAEVSHRSQSATSMQIKQLEEQLGVSLFHRTTRHIQITHEGERLLQAARQALAALDAGLRDIRDTGDLQKGSVLIGCVPTIASTRLPYALALFEKLYPGVTVHVREMLSIALFESVRRQEVDFGIGPQTNDSKALCFQAIYSDEMCAFVPRSYKLARKDAITLREISQFPVLTWGNQTTLDAALTPILEREGISFNTKYEVTEPHTAVAMSAAGLGIAILPRIMLPAQGHPSLRILPLAGVSLSRQISIITLRGNTFSPAAAHLAQILERLIDPEKAKQYAARNK